jgi:molecular chaperone DnaK
VAAGRVQEGRHRPLEDPSAQRLRAAEAKIELSTTSSTEINLPYITADVGPSTRRGLSQAKLEDPSATSSKTRSGEAAQGRRPQGDDIDEVILAAARPGCASSTRSTMFNGRAPRGRQPDEVVGIGAAIQAYWRATSDVLPT